jgi:hypothetical protein
MPMTLEQALDYPGEMVAVWDWSAEDERLSLCSVADGKLGVLAAADMSKAERKAWEDKLIERKVRVGYTAGVSPFTWSIQRGFTVWSLTDAVVVASDGFLKTEAGARIRFADVARVVAFLDDASLGHRGVKIVTHGGAEIWIAEEADPAAQLDPTYGMDNVQIDAAWVTFMARDLAEWLGVPLTGELA